MKITKKKKNGMFSSLAHLGWHIRVFIPPGTFQVVLVHHNDLPPSSANSNDFNGWCLDLEAVFILTFSFLSKQNLTAFFSSIGNKLNRINIIHKCQVKSDWFYHSHYGNNTFPMIHLDADAPILHQIIVIFSSL